MREQRISARDRDLLIDGKDRNVAHVIDNLVRQINFAEENIRDGIDAIERRCQDVRVMLDQGRILNELGEFQSQPRDVDRNIALLGQAQQNLAAIIGPEAAKMLLAPKGGK